MKKKSDLLTTAEFARLHEVNKRTLHYYDAIGLFSPKTKGENNYRYYDARQSIDFEYIRMLKELNMSIEEIRTYMCSPNPEDFIKIVDQKTKEIQAQIQKMKKALTLLKVKKEQLSLCSQIRHQKIQIIRRPEEKYRVMPFDLDGGNHLKSLFSAAKQRWGIDQCRMGIGSYISVEKAAAQKFDQYDGIFSPALSSQRSADLLIRPQGTYLCGYQRGCWDELPDLYEEMLSYADHHDLTLTGYAFESGMNDFAIADDRDYITQILIQIK
ncbi:MAG: MerR family transcriptional regulator [Catenibacillus sp.]